MRFECLNVRYGQYRHEIKTTDKEGRPIEFTQEMLVWWERFTVAKLAIVEAEDKETVKSSIWFDFTLPS
jgi:hypothetical protein